MDSDEGREERGGQPPLAPGREFDLIRTFYPAVHSPARSDVRLGTGDDCAVVVGEGIALSNDLSVENVHFRRVWLSPVEIGYRAAAAALSDLAAVAARPIGVLTALGVPDEDVGEVVTSLMAGVRGAVEAVGGILLGGDLSRVRGPLVIDVTVVGEARNPVVRGGARSGDVLWVTGELGAPALAVADLLAGRMPSPEVRQRFVAPVPRTREALWLAERELCHSMIDLSDGLGGDAAHIATASGVGVILDRTAIPIHPAVTEQLGGDEALRLAVSGGEEYELCFSAAPGAVEKFAAAFQEHFELRLTRVGRIVSGDGVWIEDSTGLIPLQQGGFQHFGGAG